MKFVLTMLTAGIGGIGSSDVPAEPTTSADSGANAARGCVEFHTTYRWQPIDDSHLVIWQADDIYLVETSMPLTQLRRSQHIDFVDGDADGQLCGARGDKIIVAGAELSQQAGIVAVTRLESEQVAQMIERHDGPGTSWQNEEAASS